MNVQQPFLIPWMQGLSNQQAVQVAAAQQAAQQAQLTAQQQQQQAQTQQQLTAQQQHQIHNGAQVSQQQTHIHPGQHAQHGNPHSTAQQTAQSQLQQLQSLQKAGGLPTAHSAQAGTQHSVAVSQHQQQQQQLQLAQISALQQQYSSALQHAAAVAAANAAAGQPGHAQPGAGAGLHQSIPALAAAAAAAAAQQQQQTQQHVQTSVAQPAMLYANQNGIQSNQQAQLHAHQMQTLQGMHGLLQTPSVSTVSSYNGQNNNHAAYLAAAAQAANPHYSTVQKILIPGSKDGSLLAATINGFPLSTAKITEKRKIIEEIALADVKKAKIETKALKAKRPGFTDDRYNETEYYVENGLRKVYPYYFTFTTFTKGRWVGEKILEVFGREFRAHPVEEYERCILDGTLTVNYEQVDVDYRLKHNDLLANIVHRHETPVLSKPIDVIHLSEDLVVLDKPCSLPVHPCGRYRHNTVVFILAKEYNLKNLRTIHRLDRLTSGLLMFGRNPKKARDMEQQIRNRQVLKEYVCRVEGEFPEGVTECTQPVEVVSYKIGVCKVSPSGKECRTEFERLNYNGRTSVVLCRPFTGRMHQIRVHLQYLGFPVINDPLYNHTVFGPNKGKGGIQGKSDAQLIQDLIAIHNAENWLGMDGDSELSMFNKDGKDGEKDKGMGGDCPDSKTPSPCSDPNSPSGDSNNSKGAINGGKSAKHTYPDLIRPTGNYEVDNRNILASLENNPNVPRNCTITRPPPITKPCSYRDPVILREPLETESTEPITEQDNELLTKHKEYRYMSEKMTWDPHCYECKVRYRDPKAKDLVMYLHAWRYKGPDWDFQTKLPEWADENWMPPN